MNEIANLRDYIHRNFRFKVRISELFEYVQRNLWSKIFTFEILTALKLILWWVFRRNFAKVWPVCGFGWTCFKSLFMTLKICLFKLIQNIKQVFIKLHQRANSLWSNFFGCPHPDSKGRLNRCQKWDLLAFQAVMQKY